MTKKEFFTLSIGLKAAYPRFTFLATDEEMEFWYMLLRDIDYRVAENSVMEHISTNAFPPSIAEIRRLCVERCVQQVLSFDEAWGVVQRAMSIYGWEHPQEAFMTMDELTLSVVKNLGWSRLCHSEKSVADFREAYEVKAKALQDSNQLPEFVAKNKELLKEQYIPVVEAKKIPQIGQGSLSHEAREELTDEQLEERGRRFEEERRKVFGDKK